MEGKKKKTEMIAVSFSTTASCWIFLYCITLSVSCLSLYLTSGSSFLLLDCCHIFFNLGTFYFELRVSTLLSQILLCLNKVHCYKNVHVRLVTPKEEAKSLNKSAFCSLESWDGQGRSVICQEFYWSLQYFKWYGT